MNETISQPQWTAHRLPAAFGSAPAVQAAPVAAAPRRASMGMLVAAILAAVLLGGAAGIGGGYLGASLAPGSQTVPVAGPGTITVNNPGSVGEATAIAARVLPSVVTIDVSNRSGTSAGSGSGVVLSADGYIVTNAHVVNLDGNARNTTLRVTASDGRLLDATVVGIDVIYDLAVIKVDATGLTPIEFADSAALNVGDTAVTVGAPLGLSNSVAAGIVSALNRSISVASSAVPDTGDETDDEDTPFRFPGQNRGTGERISLAVIQTDAAINPGNSGGALVDSAGRLIGIVVAIATTGGSDEPGSIGLGFAIPSHIVQRVTGELMEHGEATHALLGARVQPSSSIDGTTVAGAYIVDVSPGEAAEAVGLAAGDVVTGLGSIPITSANDLTAQVRALAAGTTTTIT